MKGCSLYGYTGSEDLQGARTDNDYSIHMEMDCNYLLEHEMEELILITIRFDSLGLQFIHVLNC